VGRSSIASPPRHSKQWADYCREIRKKAKLNRTKAAARIGIDSSYITLFERDGLIPRHEIVAKIGEALDNPRRAELMAGYVPSGYAEPFKVLFDFLESKKARALFQPT